MNLPFGNETVTLYSRSERTENGRHFAVYTRQALSGCSWRTKSAAYVQDGTWLRKRECVCRVPPGQAVPKVGDLLILGAIEDEVASSADFEAILRAWQDSGGAFVAAEVTDNTTSAAPLPHYCVKG